MNFDIILEEVKFKFVRSGGKGGQNVNKVSTKVEMVFNVCESNGLSIEEKEWILTKLSKLLIRNCEIRIVSEKFRSQLKNKFDTEYKLELCLNNALKKPKNRKKTLPSKSSKESKLKQKKIQSEKKTLRKKFNLEL